MASSELPCEYITILDEFIICPINVAVVDLEKSHYELEGNYGLFFP